MTLSHRSIILFFAAVLVHSITSAFVSAPSNINIVRVANSVRISLQQNPSSVDEIQNHLKHQRESFDAASSFFNSEEVTPPEVVPILQWLTRRALRETTTISCHQNNDGLKILDVGCGTGALFRHYIEAADELGIVGLNITGIDLSPKMIQFATENAKQITMDHRSKKDGNQHHSITCTTGDFVQEIMGVVNCRETLTGFHDGILDESTAKYRGIFDAVMINSCFGNFYDRNSVITAAATCLKNDGVFIIAHPLGAEFVARLGEKNPSSVPGRLPSSERTLSDKLQFQPLETVGFVDGATIDGTATAVYYASMRKLPHRKLRKIVRLRGPVDEGFGRGGKKLGFPTANLPSSLFSNALIDVPTGVYIGFALIEESSVNGNKGRGMVHKAVVNVGYSPTFDGQENKEKIVEAHLIIDEGEIEGDFYGETMRLGLFGSLRPEMKFPSFPELIQAITNDVATAKASLDSEPYTSFRDDLLFNEESEWVGRDGGDNHASFEFKDISMVD